MTADRYRVELYRRGVHLRRYDQLTNLDPADDTILRDWLEQLVKQDRGTLRIDLSAGWELRVRIPDGRRVVASCRVDRSGRTVVKR
jgi:hypothetical protein